LEGFVQTIAVNPQPGAGQANSAAFSLKWPIKTVQLVWRVKSAQPKSIHFAVTQNGAKVAENMEHEGTAGRLGGDGFTITDVSGASELFALEVYANVVAD
jgi:hypothetical protein